jgi:hypothetical protein
MRSHGTLIVMIALAVPAFAERTPRSATELRAFKRANPCPSTGQRRGACPGYVVDHVEPMCAGGPDHRSNMQWQTVADAKAKDRLESAACRSLKAAPAR